LNSLASTTVVDFYRARAKSVTDTAALRIARLATVAWGGVLLTIAIAARHSKSVLEAGLTIGSIPMGALLGVFLLGVLTRKPREGAAIAGVVAGLSIVIGIHFYTPIAWTWYVLIGTVTTFAVGLLASLFQGAAPIPLETTGVRQPSGGLPHLPSRHANPEE
jgi:Na+/proline symporter